MEFLIEYGMFLARVATILIAIIIVVGVIASSGQKQKKVGKGGSIRVTRPNDHINDLREALRLSILDKDDLKALHKKEKKTSKAELKEQKESVKKQKTLTKTYLRRSDILF